MDSNGTSAIEKVRMRLLDLTSRNKLLKFNHNSQYALRVIDETPNHLAGSILSGSGVYFDSVPTPDEKELLGAGFCKLTESNEKVAVNPGAEKWAAHLGIDTSYSLPLSSQTDAKKHQDDAIQTLIFEPELNKKLKKISNLARISMSETGANMLYMAFGFLQWKESGEQSTQRSAPLFLIPVELVFKANKNRNNYRCYVQHTGDEIVLNLSLKEKLKIDFNLDIPELDENDRPEEYMAKFDELVTTNNLDWQVTSEVTLGMFEFSKLLMYLDLAPERWPENENQIEKHPVLKHFFSSEETLADEYTSKKFDVDSKKSKDHIIDQLPGVHQKFPIVSEADSSQHSAIVDVVNGEDLVIEGPPGTGKSQTITNIIAAAMQQGKRVLFVAEKMAALDVVKRRLENVGLGAFCLEIHSNKINKKLVNENMRERVELMYNTPPPRGDIEKDIARFEQLKNTLTGYVELLNSPWLKTEWTLQEILETSTHYRSADIPSLPHNHEPGILIDASKSRHAEWVDKLSDYANSAQEALGESPSNLSTHPWYGIRNKDLMPYELEDTKDILLSILDNIKHVNQFISLFSSKYDLDKDDGFLCAKQLGEDIKKLASLTLHNNLSLQQISEMNIEHVSRLSKEHHHANNEVNALLEHSRATALDLVRDHDSLVRAVTLDELLLNDGVEGVADKINATSRVIGLCEHAQKIPRIAQWLGETMNINNSYFTNSTDGLDNLSGLSALMDLFPENQEHLRDLMLNDEHTHHIISSMADDMHQIATLTQAVESVFDVSNDMNLSDIEVAKFSSEKTGLDRLLGGRLKGYFYIKKHVRKGKTVVEGRDMLAKYYELAYQTNELDQNTAYKTLLGDLFCGKDTDIKSILAMSQWRRCADEKLSGHIGPEDKILAFLLESDNITIRRFKKVFMQSISPLVEQLESHTGAIKLLSKQCEYRVWSSPEKILKNLQILEKLLLSISKKYPREATLKVIASASRQSQRVAAIEDEITSDETIIQLFGDSSSQVDVSSLLHITSSLDTFLSMRSGVVRSFALKATNTGMCQRIESELQPLVELAKKQDELARAFSELTLADKSLWFDAKNNTISECESQAKRALDNIDQLTPWVDLLVKSDAINVSGVGFVLTLCGTTSVSKERLTDILNKTLFNHLSKEVMQRHDTLRQFSQDTHEKNIRLFRDADRQLFILQRESIARTLRDSATAHLEQGVNRGPVGGYTEMGLIEHEIRKQTRHVPIRQLIKRAPKSIQALKPCFMMSPLSVAQFLEPGAIKFDLLVMDEASQIKPEDAIGSIARASQVVVVGDTKQLPPSSFFSKIVNEDEVDSNAINISESILDATLPMFKTRTLCWHYRSRHQQLIEFSNKEFYNEELVVFPSPYRQSDEFGLKFMHLPNGIFVDSKNKVEAKQAALIAKEHILANRSESIGIVTMNSKQREEVENQIERLCKEDGAFFRAYNANQEGDEPLFIKNLENVQGDERDVIVISFTYGKQSLSDERVPQRFGPLNGVAGGRRLNVLFTRAKKRMIVISSMKHTDITPKSTSGDGIAAMKRFLLFAEEAQTMGGDIGAAEGNKKSLSVATNDLTNQIRQEGFIVDFNFGVSGIFVDMAVQSKSKPGTYIAAIQLDGPNYLSSNSARDRDHLKPIVLEGLGWNVLRVWTPEWFKNPRLETERIIQALHEAEQIVR
jgi:hypothetical protein